METSDWSHIEPLVPESSFDSDSERRILAGMLQFTEVVQNVIRFLLQSKTLFRSQVANQLAGRILDYFERYNTTPFDDITRFLADAPQDIQTLAESLVNVKIPSALVVLDITEKHFQEVQLEQHTDTVRQLLNSGNIKAAQEIMAAFSPIQRSQSVAFDPFDSPDVIHEAFAVGEQSLLTFDRPDEKAFYDDVFSKESFVLMLASEKGKKSMFMLDFSIRAVSQNRKVAYFECGDLSRNQLIKRFVARVSGVPNKVCSYEMPTELDVAEQNKILQYNITSNRKENRHVLTAERAIKGVADWLKTYDSVGKMRISVYANSTQSVSGVNAILDEWALEGWIPDFVVLDYADLLKPEIKGEVRHQIDEIYRQLRKLSQVRKCCLITATQATRGSAQQPFMSRDLISEAKSKLAHVTACLGLHSNMKEMESNVIKINHVVRREGLALPHMPMFCATALEVCQPAAAVYYPHYRDNPHLFPKFDIAQNTFSDFDAFAEGASPVDFGVVDFNVVETPNPVDSGEDFGAVQLNTSFEFTSVQPENNVVSGQTTVDDDDDW